MEEAEYTLREFEAELKGHPRTEIRRFCEEAGFTRRQTDATILCLFNDYGISQEEQADKLNMSVSTFKRRKKRLAGQLYTYLIHNNITHPYKMSQK